jgi:predicted nucleic acid-binding protein
MTSESFFDTNVILYLLTGDAQKADRSAELVRAGGLVSVQVLNECVRVLRRKFGASWKEIGAASQAIREACEVVAVTEDVHVKGLWLAGRYKLDIYDAMIVATALLSGCKLLYSEDMHAGLVIEGLTITNPYLPR